MRYDKYTWQTGEVITAAKLNHIEDGIAAIGSGQYTIEPPSASDSSPVFKAHNNAVKAGDIGVTPNGQICYIVTNAYPQEGDDPQSFVTLTVTNKLPVINEWTYSAKDEGFIIKSRE